MSVPTGAGNYPAGVTDSHPYFTDQSEPSGKFIETTTPCEEMGCRNGLNEYNDYQPCGTCRGKGEIEIEVHADCERTEAECTCFEEAA